MEVKAQAKFVRIQTRKLKIVTDLVREKPTTEALVMLSFMPNYGARVAEQVIKSAVANAKNNYKLDPEKLYVAKIFADRATPYKRMRAASRGRGVTILHRQSHLTVYVSPMKEEVKAEKHEKAKGKASADATEAKAVKKGTKETKKSGTKSTSKRA